MPRWLRITPALALPVVSLVLATAAIGQAERPAGDTNIDAVSCIDQTLTICQDKYCFTTFRPGGHDLYRFDFAHGTYDVPSMKINNAPMKDLAIERVGTTFMAKFRIELGKPVYVQFVKNVPKGMNGPTGEPPEMTAARKGTYSATPDRSAIDSIVGMQCSLIDER